MGCIILFFNNFIDHAKVRRAEILVNAVIPARMPVSSAMEGNFQITLRHDLGFMPNYSFTSV